MNFKMKSTLAIEMIFLLLFRASETFASFECRADQVDDEANCYRVSTILAYPYVMLRDTNSSEALTLNGTGHAEVKSQSGPMFQGLLIDYLNELARLADFKYHLKLVKDGKYGFQVGNPNNILAKSTWNGLIGELITNDTDIALAPLTVTPEREQVVDFTIPFDHFQAVVVYWKRPSRESSDATSIKSIEDLVRLGEDNTYRYGVVQNGNIYNYLKRFEDVSIMKKISTYLDKNPFQPKSNEAGLARVQQDLSYAFIVEEPAIRAAMRLPPCLLQAVPTNFYRRFYSLAVRKCSPLKERLNSAMMEMMDSGSFDRMTMKWWGVDHCGAPALGVTLIRCLAAALFTFLFF